MDFKYLKQTENLTQIVHHDKVVFEVSADELTQTDSYGNTVIARQFEKLYHTEKNLPSDAYYELASYIHSTKPDLGVDWAQTIFNVEAHVHVEDIMQLKTNFLHPLDPELIRKTEMFKEVVQKIDSLTAITIFTMVNQRLYDIGLPYHGKEVKVSRN